MTNEPKFDEPAAVATLADLHAYGTGANPAREGISGWGLSPHGHHNAVTGA